MEKKSTGSTVKVHFPAMGFPPAGNVHPIPPNTKWPQLQIPLPRLENQHLVHILRARSRKDSLGIGPSRILPLRLTRASTNIATQPRMGSMRHLTVKAPSHDAAETPVSPASFRYLGKWIRPLAPVKFSNHAEQQSKTMPLLFQARGLDHRVKGILGCGRNVDLVLLLASKTAKNRARHRVLRCDSPR